MNVIDLLRMRRNRRRTEADADMPARPRLWPLDAPQPAAFAPQSPTPQSDPGDEDDVQGMSEALTGAFGFPGETYSITGRPASTGVTTRLALALWQVRNALDALENAATILARGAEADGRQVADIRREIECELSLLRMLERRLELQLKVECGR